MSKKIKKIIKRCRQSLAYSVENITGESVKTLEIQSDHAMKTHKIYVPATDVRGIELLHELGHATLSEKIHPLFSITEASFFNIPSHEIMMSVLIPAFRAADDWFVDQWLFELAPDEVKSEVSEHYHLVSRSGIPDDLHMFFGSALFTAQAVKYLDIKPNITGDLKKAVDVFLAIRPDKPTVQKLHNLINGLLSIYTPYRVNLSGDKWGFYNG